MRCSIRGLFYLSLALLTACGQTVKVEGNADRVWQVTLSTLRATGALTKADELRAMEGSAVRPRIDYAEGEIDLPFRGDFYRGESALFVVVDVAKPDRIEQRSVRIGIDSELGNLVVRPGRALDSRATDAFAQKFLAALKIADQSVPPSIPIVLPEAHASTP
ncbi:MAG: hypothetical protein EXS10_07290 [Phycisphaerales bacterium]|nr:hypothetical protein [Phycisphaerales bacterium]